MDATNNLAKSLFSGTLRMPHVNLSLTDQIVEQTLLLSGPLCINTNRCNEYCYVPG